MRNQFYQTALGNCRGLKVPKCWLQFKKMYCVIYYNFRHTFVPYWKWSTQGTSTVPIVSAHFRSPCSCCCSVVVERSMTSRAATLKSATHRSRSQSATHGAVRRSTSAPEFPCDLRFCGMLNIVCLAFRKTARNHPTSFSRQPRTDFVRRCSNRPCKA